MPMDGCIGGGIIPGYAIGYYIIIGSIMGIGCMPGIAIGYCIIIGSIMGVAPGIGGICGYIMSGCGGYVGGGIVPGTGYSFAI